MFTNPRFARPLALLRSAMRPPSGLRRITLALFIGIFCHLIFAIGVLTMITAMFFGMSESLGTVPWPWAIMVNGLLILQFPLAHSWLLTGQGGKLLACILPGEYGSTLSTTTYAIVASIQLLLLFAFWTPSGIILWQAEGETFWFLCSAYATSWLLLAIASFDAGVEVQSGALGWLSMLANKKPVFPDMPTLGLFNFIRHPIYAAFVLTLWTVPTWTPDQLCLAISLTLYCILAPILKERRFVRRYGKRFESYCNEVPYMIPARKRRRSGSTVNKQSRAAYHD
ncbi:MAG: isoprenylcysteine carboxylmethyltransferase family protein [Pseudomonadota bacterium]